MSDERPELKPDEARALTRRRLLKAGVQGACLLGLGGAVAALARTGQAEHMVWQLDPYKCIQCGKCATNCVLTPSAVKCVHAFAICGYCELCTGYFEPEPNALNTGAENQLCPTGAIKRKFVEDPYYQYTVDALDGRGRQIDEPLCIGCAKCVKGCGQFGNGSLFLQVRHDRCLNCNECSIARNCPSQAYRRVPASRPYLLKDKEHQK